MNKITEKIGKKIRLSVFSGNSGIANVLVMFGLLLMAVAIPVASNLVQQNQETRGKAAVYECETNADCGGGNMECKNHQCRIKGCIPSCAGAGQICKGETFIGNCDNLCNGTKTCDKPEPTEKQCKCLNASNHCPGTSWKDSCGNANACDEGTKDCSKITPTKVPTAAPTLPATSCSANECSGAKIRYCINKNASGQGTLGQPTSCTNGSCINGVCLVTTGTVLKCTDGSVSGTQKCSNNNLSFDRCTNGSWSTINCGSGEYCKSGQCVKDVTSAMCAGIGNVDRCGDASGCVWVYGSCRKVGSVINPTIVPTRVPTATPTLPNDMSTCTQAEYLSNAKSCIADDPLVIARCRSVIVDGTKSYKWQGIGRCQGIQVCAGAGQCVDAPKATLTPTAVPVTGCNANNVGATCKSGSLIGKCTSMYSERQWDYWCDVVYPTATPTPVGATNGSCSQAESSKANCGSDGHSRYRCTRKDSSSPWLWNFIEDCAWFGKVCNGTVCVTAPVPTISVMPTVTVATLQCTWSTLGQSCRSFDGYFGECRSYNGGVGCAVLPSMECSDSTASCLSSCGGLDPITHRVTTQRVDGKCAYSGLGGAGFAGICCKQITDADCNWYGNSMKSGETKCFNGIVGSDLVACDNGIPSGVSFRYANCKSVPPMVLDPTSTPAANIVGQCNWSTLGKACRSFDGFMGECQSYNGSVGCVVVPSNECSVASQCLASCDPATQVQVTGKCAYSGLGGAGFAARCCAPKSGCNWYGTDMEDGETKCFNGIFGSDKVKCSGIQPYVTAHYVGQNCSGAVSSPTPTSTLAKCVPGASCNVKNSAGVSVPGVCVGSGTSTYCKQKYTYKCLSSGACQSVTDDSGSETLAICSASCKKSVSPTVTKVPTPTTAPFNGAKCYCHGNCGDSVECAWQLKQSTYYGRACSYDSCFGMPTPTSVAKATPTPIGYKPTATPVGYKPTPTSSRACYCPQRDCYAGSCSWQYGKSGGNNFQCPGDFCSNKPTVPAYPTVKPTSKPNVTVTTAPKVTPTTPPALCKQDKTGANNPACCCDNSQCPGTQQCNIPNGYCKSGSSCNPNPSGLTKKKCAYDASQGKNICASQPVQPGEDPTDECSVTNNTCSLKLTPIPTTTGGWPSPKLTSVPTIPVGPLPTEKPINNCDYSLVSRVHKDDKSPWVTDLAMKVGEKVTIGCIAKDAIAKDVRITVKNKTAGVSFDTNAGIINQWTVTVAGNYEITCKKIAGSCNGKASDVAKLTVTANGGSCPNECPKTFSCFQNGTDKKWFADGYQMTGYTKVVDTLCTTSTKPTFLGKGKGDANCSGVVDGADYSIWRKEYQDEIKTGTKWEADFNCDNKTDGADYSLWRRTYIDFNGGNN